MYHQGAIAEKLDGMVIAMNILALWECDRIFSVEA
jgi:hypothetical protein